MIHIHVWRFGTFVPSNGSPAEQVWLCAGCGQIEATWFFEGMG